MGAIINGREYAWDDLTVTALGRPYERITEIMYSLEEDKKQIYGRGRKVKGIQRGNQKPTSSLTLGQSEVEAMTRDAQKLNPLATILDIRMDVQVHYFNGTDLVKDKIIGFQATKFEKGLKQGDSDMEVKLEGMCEDILYNQ